jgi:hypothetical protein
MAALSGEKTLAELADEGQESCSVLTVDHVVPWSP